MGRLQANKHHQSASLPQRGNYLILAYYVKVKAPKIQFEKCSPKWQQFVKNNIPLGDLLVSPSLHD